MTGILLSMQSEQLIFALFLQTQLFHFPQLAEYSSSNQQK